MGQEAEGEGARGNEAGYQAGRISVALGRGGVSSRYKVSKIKERLLGYVSGVSKIAPSYAAKMSSKRKSNVSSLRPEMMPEMSCSGERTEQITKGKATSQRGRKGTVLATERKNSQKK